MQSLVIHCDGSSLSNPGPAAGGFYIEGTQVVQVKGFEQASNNLVELNAVLLALNYCLMNPEFEVEITTDSGYTFDGLTKYAPGWVDRHWKGVKNVELFRAAYYMYKEMKGRVTLTKVKGHSDHFGNQVINDAVQLHAKRIKNGITTSGLTELPLREVFESRPIIYKDYLNGKLL